MKLNGKALFIKINNSWPKNGAEETKVKVTKKE